MSASHSVRHNAVALCNLVRSLSSAGASSDAHRKMLDEVDPQALARGITSDYVKLLIFLLGGFSSQVTASLASYNLGSVEGDDGRFLAKVYSLSVKALKVNIKLPLAAFLDDGKAEAKLQTVHKIFAAVQSRHASIVKAEIDRLSSPAGPLSRPVSRAPQRPGPSASMATAFSRRAANPAQGHSPYNARPMAAPRTGAVTPSVSPASLIPRPRSNVQSSSSRVKATSAPGLRPARGAAHPSSSSSTVTTNSPFKSPSRPRAKLGETTSPTRPAAGLSPVGRESSVTSGTTSPPPVANFCYAGPSSVDVEVEGDIDDDDDALESTCQSYLGSTGLSSQALLSPTSTDMARREPPQGVPRLQIERIPSTDQGPSAAEAAAAAIAAAAKEAMFGGGDSSSFSSTTPLDCFEGGLPVAKYNQHCSPPASSTSLAEAVSSKEETNADDDNDHGNDLDKDDSDDDEGSDPDEVPIPTRGAFVAKKRPIVSAFQQLQWADDEIPVAKLDFPEPSPDEVPPPEPTVKERLGKTQNRRGMAVVHAQASMDDMETDCDSLSKPQDAPVLPPPSPPAPAVAPALAPAPTPAPASTTAMAPAPAPPPPTASFVQKPPAAPSSDETAPSHATAPSTVAIKGILKPRDARKSPKSKGVKGTVLVRWPQKFASSIKLNQLQCCPEDGFDTLEASICVNRRDSDDDYDFDEDDYESDGEPDPNAWTDKPRMGIARAVAKSKAQAAQKLYSGGGDNEEEPVDASFHQTMSFTIPRASLDASLTGSEASDDVSFTLDANALAGLMSTRRVRAGNTADVPPSPAPSSLSDSSLALNVDALVRRMERLEKQVKQQDEQIRKDASKIAQLTKRLSGSAPLPLSEKSPSMPAPPMSSTLEVEMGGAANQEVDTDSDALSTNTTSEAEQTVTDSKGPESTFVTVAPQTPFDHTIERPVEELVRRKHTEGALAAAEAAKRPINWTEDIIEMTEEERKKLRYAGFKELHGEIVDLLCRTPACRDNTEANKDLLIYADPLGESQCSYLGMSYEFEKRHPSGHIIQQRGEGGVIIPRGQRKSHAPCNRAAELEMNAFNMILRGIGGGSSNNNDEADD